MRYISFSFVNVPTAPPPPPTSYDCVSSPLVSGCVHAYFAKAESAFWNADSKRRSKTPLIQAIVRAQVNRKGVYMTSFKRGYNVILRSCFHQNQRFALTHDRKRTFLGCVHAYFAKPFWNADSKRRSKTPFTEVLFMLPSRRRRYVYRRRHVSEFSECLIQAIVRAQVNRKGVYMTSFKRGYNVILRSCFHQNQRFALTTFVNAHFWAFWIGVLKRVYSKISMDATAFCSNHVWKRWFWPQKLSINAPRFESSFWNAFSRK